MRILTLDCWLDPDIDSYTFGDPISIFDYDIVIWDPGNTLDGYQSEPYHPTFQGLRRISENDSSRLLGDISRRRKDFEQFIELGRTLVVFAAPPQRASYDTGERRTSGIGRNQKVTYILNTLDVNDALPFTYTSTIGTGEAITAKNDRLKALLRDYKNEWYYRALLEEYPGTSIAVVAGTNKCVSAIYRHESGGIALLLPDLEAISDNSDGDHKADSPTERPDLIANLIAWIESLNATPEDLPAWASEYQFNEDEDRSVKLAALESESLEILRQIDDLKVKQAEEDKWKLLFTAQGSTLEHQVFHAFKVLGFEVEEGPPGRSDLRLGWKGRRAVVEIKGTSKSASEKYAAQLEKWVTEEMIETENRPKGILVVNTWRELSLDKRTEPSFPHQMLNFSEHREHCLMTGVQLLAMVRSHQSDPSNTPSICDLIMSTVGVMPGWDNLEHLFTSKGNTDTASANESDPAG